MTTLHYLAWDPPPLPQIISLNHLHYMKGFTCSISSKPLCYRYYYSIIQMRKTSPGGLSSFSKATQQVNGRARILTRSSPPPALGSIHWPALLCDSFLPTCGVTGSQTESGPQMGFVVPTLYLKKKKNSFLN